jgi:hypothetical protein
MKKIVTIITLFIATLFIGCGGVKLTPEKQALIDEQTVLYTQVSMWTEKNRVDGTNYSTGLHIPVNTEVSILQVSGKAIVFMMNGEKMTYLTKTKYTKLNSNQMLDRLFGTQKVNLSGHSPATIENINNGAVAMGMTKDEVLLARGYPPFHATAGVESDKWKYWRNRWVTAIITFKDGKVSAIKGTVS